MVHPKLSRIRYLAISREIPAEITRNQVTKSANTIIKKKGLRLLYTKSAVRTLKKTFDYSKTKCTNALQTTPSSEHATGGEIEEYHQITELAVARF